SSLYTLTTTSRSGPLSPQLHASAHVATQCECRRLSHDTLLWHHRLGHPSLPRLRSMHSRFLVSGLPRSLPPLPPSPAPPCIPCVEGRQRAAPHSTLFPPTEPRALRERFQSDFPVLRLHSDRGGEFSSDLLATFCAEHGIRQTFTLPASPQQNGVAERRIGLVMEVARTSMIHAAAPHFLWPFAVRYAAHQLNLWPRVSLPETSPTLLWTGKVGDTSLLRPPSHRVFGSQDVTFDESVPFYRLFPYRTAPHPPPPLFLAPGPPQVDPPSPTGPAPSSVSQVDPPTPAPVEVTGDSGLAASGAVPRGAELGGAESGGTERVEPGGAEPAREEPGGAASRGTASGGATSGGAEPVCAEPGGAESGGPAPSSVSQVDPPTPAPVEVTGDSGLAASGAVPRGAELGGAESGGTERVEPGGAEPAREEPGGAASRGTASGGATSGGAEP
ncbi:unnamed protein product, partial [Closterium sp. NIES-53]